MTDCHCMSCNRATIDQYLYIWSIVYFTTIGHCKRNNQSLNSHDISTIVAVMHHVISFNLHKVYFQRQRGVVVCFWLFSVSTYFMRWNNNIYHNKAACWHKVRTCILFDFKLNPLVIYYSANSIYICSEAINFMPWPCNVCVYCHWRHSDSPSKSIYFKSTWV